MSDFAPSVHGAQAAVGKVEHRLVATGAPASKMSLEEIAKKIREGRLDPRVRAWAGNALIAAGKPRTVREQSRAILAALHRQTMYALDPVGAEMIVAAKNTLCLDKHGLCMPVGDCDDLTVALGSAIMSVGIPIRVVAQYFGGSTVPTHVFIAVDTDRGWEYIDPSTDTFDIGQSHPGSNEKWIDPMEEGPIALSGQGDYVGVGFAPFSPAEVIASITMTDEQKRIVWEFATGQLLLAVSTLERSVYGLEASLKQIEGTRQTLRPGQPYDPEPSSPIESIASFPHDGTWTRRMSEISMQLINVGSVLVAAGKQALDGARKIYFDTAQKDIFIEAKDGDPWRIETVAKRAANFVFAFVSPGGAILSGLLSSDGKALTPQEVEAERAAARAEQSGTGTSGYQIVVGIVAVGVVITAIAAYFAFAKYCDNASLVAKEATRQEILKAVQASISSGMPPDEAWRRALELEKQQGQNRVAEEEARAKANANDPFTKFTENVGKIFMWLALGGAVAGGMYLAAPFVRHAAEGLQRKPQERT